MRRTLVLLAVLFFAGAAFAQPAVLAPCLVAGTDCSSGSGVSGLTSGRVTLSTGATTVGDDAGLTGGGTGTGFKLGIGTDVFVSRAFAGTLLVEDGSGNARDVQARTFSFGTSVLGSLSANSTGYVLLSDNVAGTKSVVLGSGILYPNSDNAQDLGVPGAIWRTGYFGTSVVVGTATWTSGNGSPETVVTAPVGSFYSRLDGGAGTSWYVKESGAGNTGWVAK